MLTILIPFLFQKYRSSKNLRHVTTTGSHRELATIRPTFFMKLSREATVAFREQNWKLLVGNF